MSVCGSCPLYSNETCEGGRRGAEICQERLFDYIDELDSKLSQYINGKKPGRVIVEDDVKLGAVTWKAGTTIYKCPCCDRLMPYGNKHCPNCGQKIDWS